MRHLTILLASFLAMCANLQAQVSWEKAAGTDSIAILTFFHHQQRCFAGSVDSGIYISDDLGSSWRYANAGILDSAQLRVVNDFSPTGDTIYTAFGHALGGHIYRSTDRGDHWMPTTFPTGATDLVASGPVVCASTGSGFFVYFRSTDSGNTWTSTSHPFPQYHRNYKNLRDTLYALSNSLGFRISFDRGATWQSRGFTGIMCFDYLVTNDLIFLSNQEGLYLSADRGMTWNAANTSGLGIDFQSIYHFSMMGDTVFAASDSVVYYSCLAGASLSDWQHIPRTGLPAFTPTHVIRSLDAWRGYLKVGTEDLMVSGSSSTRKGTGIWITNIHGILTNTSPPAELSLSLFPNPTGGMVNIVSPVKIREVRLRDMSGRLLAYRKKSNCIDLRGYPPGIYFLNILTEGNRMVSRKVVRIGEQ